MGFFLIPGGERVVGGSAVNTRRSHFMNNDATVFSPRVNFSPEAQEQHRAAGTRLKQWRQRGALA